MSSRRPPKGLTLPLLLVLALCLFVAGAQASREPKVALVMKALSNPFFGKMEAGAKEYADAHGVKLEVFGVERETDVDRQIGIVEDLISRGGYQAIVIAPADSRRLVPVCKKALEKGIVVINIDNPFRREALARYGVSIPFVGSDNEQGAALVGAYIKRKLKGTGRVLVIEGIPGAENADLRKQGFIRSVTGGSGIKVVASETANWHTEEALAVVTRLLDKHPDVDAILCANDKMALGALQALDMRDQAGRILVTGYDNIQAVRHEMHLGRVHATVEQHPEMMGRIGVRLALQALEGETVPGQVATPLDLITCETFDKRVALSISELKNPFFKALHDSALRTARLFGMTLLTADARNDEAQQIADMQRFVDEKVDLIVLNPTGTQIMGTAVELANGAGVPVITVDRQASGGEIVCHIASDNLDGGRMAGAFVAEQLGGKGTVVEIEGIPGTSAAQKRGVGFNEVLQGHPDIHVVGRTVAYFDRDKARVAMSRLLKENHRIDAVFAHNDNMILGVLDALEENPGGRRPRVLVGFDGIPEALEAIRSGRLTATIAQKPELMGQLAIQSAVQWFRGEELPSDIPVDLELVKQ